MCSCLASNASLLKVFHIASVSGVISRVSRKSVALEEEGSKAQRMSPGSGRHQGILVMGQGRRRPGNYLSFLSNLPGSPVFTTLPRSSSLRIRLSHHLVGYQPSPSPGIVAVINGCSKLNKALIQCVGNCSHTFGHHHLRFSPAPLQSYNITL